MKNGAGLMRERARTSTTRRVFCGNGSPKSGCRKFSWGFPDIVYKNSQQAESCDGMNNDNRRFEQEKNEYQQNDAHLPGKAVFHVTLKGAGKRIKPEEGEEKNSDYFKPAAAEERGIGKEQGDDVEPLGNSPGLQSG